MSRWGILLVAAMGLVLGTARMANATTTTTTIPIPDWTDTFVGVWHFDPSQSAGYGTNFTSGCGTNCNLTSNGDPDGAPSFLHGVAPSGAGAVRLDPGGAVGNPPDADDVIDTLTRAHSAGNPLTTLNSSFTAACILRADLSSNGEAADIMKTLSGNTGMRLWFDPNGSTGSFDKLRCVVGDGSDTVEGILGATLQVGGSQQVGCRFNDSTDEIYTWMRNRPTSGLYTNTTTQQGHAAPNSTFAIGPTNDDSSASFLDMCWLANAPLSYEALCRLCACGVGGTTYKHTSGEQQCWCGGTDGTEYVATGTSGDEGSPQVGVDEDQCDNCMVDYAGSYAGFAAVLPCNAAGPTLDGGGTTTTSTAPPTTSTSSTSSTTSTSVTTTTSTSSTSTSTSSTSTSTVVPVTTSTSSTSTSSTSTSSTSSTVPPALCVGCAVQGGVLR